MKSAVIGSKNFIVEGKQYHTRLVQLIDSQDRKKPIKRFFIIDAPTERLKTKICLGISYQIKDFFKGVEIL